MTDSLKDKHERIVLGKAPEEWDDATRNEAAFAESMPLLPLSLAPGSRKPTRRGLRYAAFATVGAIAAAAAFVVLPKETLPPDLLPKGQTAAQLYFERAGEASAWSPSVELMDGDRIRARVQPGGDVAIYSAIVSQDGHLLSDPNAVAAAGIDAASGTDVALPGAVELIAPNEGESLLLLLCRRCRLTAAEIAALAQGPASAPPRDDVEILRYQLRRRSPN